MRNEEFKLKIKNYSSAACFFLSSASLLFVPLLDFEDGFPVSAYFLAGLFWIGLFVGAALQVYLGNKTKKAKIINSMKRPKFIVVLIFILSLISGVFALFWLRNNGVVLPINLFVTLSSVEAFYIIKRMERIK